MATDAGKKAHGWKYSYRAAPGLSQPIYRLSDRGCRLSDLLALEADGVFECEAVTGLLRNDAAPGERSITAQRRKPCP
jgi:hypothetical protein